jgi:hypothetical protein
MTDPTETETPAPLTPEQRRVAAVERIKHARVTRAALVRALHRHFSEEELGELFDATATDDGQTATQRELSSALGEAWAESRHA